VDFRVRCVEIDRIFIEKDTLHVVRHLDDLGGVWHSSKRDYVEDHPFGEETDLVWEFNPVQSQLFDVLYDIYDPDIKIPVTEVAAFGGRQTGKSEAAVRAGCSMNAIRPGSQGHIWGYDYSNAEEMLEKIRNIIPPEWELHFDAAKRIMRWKNESRIYLKTAAKPKKARSQAPDWVILDEPSWYDQPKKILNGVLPGAATNSAPTFLITSPNGHDAVYYETQKRFHKKEMVAKSVRFFDFGCTYDNPCLSNKAKRQIKVLEESMSPSQVQQELKGEVVNMTGLVLYDFARERHVNTGHPDLDDITRYITKGLFGQEYDLIGGMDFNENPISFNAFKMYEGGIMHCCAELEMNNANTTKFGTTLLIPWLQKLYPDLPEDEAKKKILIVGDASGQWQEFGKQRKRGKKEIPAFKQLKQLGIDVIPPQKVKSKGRRAGQRRRRSHTYSSNPNRGDRQESARARFLTSKGQIFVTIHEDCTETIKMCENIELYKSLPDLKSEHIHRWDALTYPIFKLFPRIDVGAQKFADTRGNLEIYDLINKYEKIKEAA
jgi:hypothetical protein